MADYLPLFLLFALGLVFAAASFFASRLLAPRRPNAAKESPYECGIVPTKSTAERFPVRFYLVAMIFIIFDIEIIFLFPWAVRFDALGLFGLVEMLVFTIAVVISLAYLISNGALDWGPRGRRKSGDEGGDSTIRRISNRVTAKEAPKAAEA